MEESGINLNFDLDESDQERILEVVKSDLVDSVLSELPASDFRNFDFYELRSKAVSLSTSLTDSPTLKTEVVRSRTQLKQQLMRDQELMKEQERRKIIEEEIAIAAESVPEPISIPLNVSSVQLPQHVLQVTSALENPTRYHILAKQKNQVMKFLSSSDNEDFVSKFDAQTATLQMKHQQQQVQLQINHRHQIRDQETYQAYNQRQLERQQQIRQRRQLQKRKQFQLQSLQQWHLSKLEQMKNMDFRGRLEQMLMMEQELPMYQERQQRHRFYLQEQHRDEKTELQQQLQARHKVEQQQLFHRHQLEKQQLQQKLQIEKQMLHQQQEQLKLQQQLQKRQRQKKLQKQAQAADKAEGEALAKAQAKILAKITGLFYGQPTMELVKEGHEQKNLLEVVQAKAEPLKEAQATEQAQVREQPQAQLQLLGQPQVQEPQQMLELQDQACALPLDPDNNSQMEVLHNFISDLTKEASISEEKSVDDVVSSDVCYTMPGNLCGPIQLGQGELDSLSQDDILNMKWSKSCPSGLEHYDQELSPNSLHHAKSRIRKDNHNIVERRRRSIINDRIKELGDLLPKVNEPYYEVVKDSKNNKGGILKATVEFIKYLKFEMIHHRQIEAGLQQENQKLLSKLKEMESKSKENEMEKEMLMGYQAWMVMKPDTHPPSTVKDDEIDKNESSKSKKSESSSQCEFMMEEDNSDKDEIC